eukprot:TRINITY_DN8129_c2_g2_i1.p1 TRINITY_DN8129_c2_g2~~TRINITY_DN8129_c2_g2_i1.p1  ORF type:complete len:356 (-),score=111.09 TRINITY_DN8129_c2_g2_i1:172-1239(-)
MKSFRMKSQRPSRRCSPALLVLTAMMLIFASASFFFQQMVVEQECDNFVLDKRDYTVLMRRNAWIDASFFKTYTCDTGITCTWTQDESYASCADAVVYMELSERPRRRLHPHQRTVYFNMESPENGLWSGARAAYDMLMTYELTSDVPVTYFGKEDPREAAMSHVEKNTPFLAMVLGNKCTGKRFEWVEELQKHTNGRIASLGKCLHNAEKYELAPECKQYAMLPNGLGTTGPEKQCLMAKFPFYLAFENSQHDDYITEKFVTTLATNTVGVYFGAPNARSFEPGPNAMIYVNDFASPKELAEYLILVAANSTLYESFHAWRKQPLGDKYKRAFASRWDNHCNLCNELHRRNGLS